MLDALDITEEEALGLGELAQHDLALARDFARRAQAAEDADEAVQLARSYQRMARSYRQTLAVKARLRREMAEDFATAPHARDLQPRPRLGRAQAAQRVKELRNALMRIAWTEAERPEVEDETPDVDTAFETLAAMSRDIWRTVGLESIDDDFCDEPLDDHVARLADELGFPPATAAAWRDLPDPPTAAADDGPDRESSA